VVVLALCGCLGPCAVAALPPARAPPRGRPPLVPDLRRVVSFRHIPDAAAASSPDAEPRLFDAQMAALTVQVLKALMGSSMFMLSGGLAGVTNIKWAWIPAAFVTMCFALMSAYTYCLVGVSCEATGAQTYTELWSKTMSPSSAWIPTTGCAVFTAIACQVYTIVMRDILAQLITSCTMALAPPQLRNDIFNSYTNSVGFLGLILRRETHLIMLGLVMLRLCLLRSLAALAKVSWVGMCGVLYLATFMTWRCVTGAYLPGGVFRHASTWPIWGNSQNLGRAIVFMSLLHGSYQVHYDAPRFFSAIALRPDPMRCFRVLAFLSFSVAGLVGVVVMTSGFLTFGSASKAVILNNYAPDDRLAFLGRVAIFVSLMSSFPLIFNGFASNMLSLADFFAANHSDTPKDAKAKPKVDATVTEAELRRRQGIKDALAVVLVLFNLSIGLSLEDLGFLCAFAGSVVSGVLIFVFPPIFHLRVLSMRAQARGLEAASSKPRQNRGNAVGSGGALGATGAPVWASGEKAWWWSSCCIASVGSVLCVLGAAVNLELI